MVDHLLGSDTDSFAQVLNGLQQKTILIPDTVLEIEASLKERDTLPAHPALSPIEANGQREPQASQTTPKMNGVARPDERQVQPRIGEHRERHKRLRESIWAVGAEEDQEVDRLWDEGSDVGEDDYMAGDEDMSDRKLAVQVK